MTEPKRLFDCIEVQLSKGGFDDMLAGKGKRAMEKIQHPASKGNCR